MRLRNFAHDLDWLQENKSKTSGRSVVSPSSSAPSLSPPAVVGTRRRSVGCPSQQQGMLPVLRTPVSRDHTSFELFEGERIGIA